MTKINLTLSDDGDEGWKLAVSGEGAFLEFLEELVTGPALEPDSENPPHPEAPECHCDECECEYEECDCECSGECSPPEPPRPPTDDELLVEELIKLQTLRKLPTVDVAARSCNQDEEGLPRTVVAYGNIPLLRFKGERDVQIACIGWCNMQGAATLYGLVGTWEPTASTYKFQVDEGRFLYALSYSRVSLEPEDSVIVVLDEETALNWLGDDDSDGFDPDEPECSLNTPENTEYDPSEADYDDDEDGF